MENIRDIVNKLGIECDADALEKAVLENYRTIAEVEGSKAKIEALEAKVSERDARIEELGAKVDELQAGTSEIDALKAKIEEYRESEAEAIKKAEAEAAEKSFAQAFDEALGGRKFANDFTRRAVMEEVKKMRGENSALGISDLIDRATKDVPDVFANPQKREANPLPTPNAGAAQPTSLRDAIAQRFAKTND